jgi:flagellar M-ring protein FliF
VALFFKPPTNPPGGGGAPDERKTAYENRLRNEVEQIVSSVVGPGRARVQITADFDLNRITQTSDRFDPESRVVRSSQTREEQSATGEGRAGGAVSVGTELPGTGAQGGAGGSRDQARKIEEIVNYEISRTTKTEVIEAGRVNRISAAVLVDGIYSKDAKGETVYQPRSKEEIDRIAALVRTAIGFDAKRGDQIEVVNLRFAEAAPMPFNEPTGWMRYFQFTKDDIMRGAEMGVMALLVLIVLLMVVRPLVRRVIPPEGMEIDEGDAVPCPLHHRRSHGIWDVVVFQVEKHAMSALHQPADNLRAGGGKKLAPDLDGTDGTTKLFGQGERPTGVIDIEGGDDGSSSSHPVTPVR